MSVAMNLAVETGDPAEYPRDIVQYWLCLAVDADRKGADIYVIEGVTYVVVGYVADERSAIGMCCTGKKVAKVTVHNYVQSQRLAHKKFYTFEEWVFDKSAKAPE